MFRALWIKHWVQLRALRWVGLGIGVLLPFFIWAGAAAGKRGWFGFSLGSYDLATLFGEALPVFSAVLWGLLAVFFAAQSFTGDRAEGTDRFLLDRPVPRHRIWLARGLAALASCVIVVIGNTLYILALVALVRHGSETAIYSQILTIAVVGLGLTVLGTIGGMAAGEMVRNPMQAVLIGCVLAALPIGSVTFFFSVFELAWVGDAIHLGVLVTSILPLALVFASYRSGCVGEPGGGGRIKRGLAVLAIALVLTPLLFAATAPMVMRSWVIGGWPEGTAANADLTVALGTIRQHRAGWMIHTDTGEKIRFLPPPIRSVAWNADGSTLAVIHQWGALGSIGDVGLELLDADGATQRSFALQGHDSFALEVSWAGELVLVREWLGARFISIRVIDPVRGVLGSVDIETKESSRWSLLGPTDDGSVYLHRLIGKNPREYALNRIDLEAFRLEDTLLTEAEDLPTYTTKLLSPSGRYLARVVKQEQTYVSRVFDLQSGTRIEYASSLISGWLSGDRLVRLEEDGDDVRLVVHRVDGEELQSRRFPRGVTAKVSPDGKRFLVTQKTVDEGWFGYAFFLSMDASGLDQLLVGDGYEWTDLHSLIEGLDGEYVWVAWGGPNTLVATNATANRIAPVRSGSSWTSAVGRWR